MTRLSARSLRDNLSDTVNRVAYKGERIVLERRGKDVAVLVPLEDLRLLEEIEDRLDLEAVREARKEPGETPFAEYLRKRGR